MFILLPSLGSQTIEKKANNSLSIDEQKYIAQNTFITVVITANYPPIDAADTLHGSSIMMSLLDLITEKTGLHFAYKIVPSFDVSTEYVSNNKAQIVAGIYNDPSWANGKNLIITKPILPLYFYEVFNEKLNSDSSQMSYVHTKEHPDFDDILLTSDQTDVLPSLYECLKAIDKGKFNKTYVNLYTLQYISHQNGFTNLSYNSSSVIYKELCLGISKNTDARLASILNKGISLIKENEKQEVIYKNTIFCSRNASFANFIKTSTLEFTLIFILFIIIFIAVVFLIILNHIRHKKNRALALAVKAKSDFLSRMSHEMRTPLTAIIGLTEIATKQDQEGESINSYLEKIDISSRHLLQIINDILDMTKISEGKMTLRKATFSLDDLLKAIYTVYQPFALKNNILLTIQKEASIPDTFVGDALRIKEILINLISNAIKYNKKEGVVTLAIKSIEKETVENGQTLRFTITDSGSGIHKTTLDKIFEPFERDALADINQIKGSGLGLPLTKKMIELMGSTIQVNSIPGIGSTFWFDLELPFGYISEKIIKEDKAKIKFSLQGRNILIAEDNDLNAEIIEQIILQMNPHEVVVTKNGKECCKIFEKSKEHYYDTIIMDIRMPVMDGYKATKMIRSMKRSDAKTVRIIALSANAYIEDKKQSLESGMNAHCAKPINKTELENALMNLYD